MKWSVNSQKFTAPFPDVPIDNPHLQIMSDDFWKKSCGLSAGVYGRKIASLFPLNSSQLYIAD